MLVEFDKSGIFEAGLVGGLADDFSRFDDDGAGGVVFVGALGVPDLFGLSHKRILRRNIEKFLTNWKVGVVSGHSCC